MQNISISVYFANSILAKVRETQSDSAVRSLLSKCQISPTLLNNSNARISPEQHATLQLRTIHALKDEFFGFLSTAVPLGSALTVSHQVVRSDNLAQALRRLCRFYNTVQSDLRFDLSLSDSEFSFTAVNLRDQALQPRVVEFLFFNLHRYCSWLIGNSLRISHVSLAYPPPTHISEYRLMFFSSPIDFSSRQNCLSFKLGAVKVPLIREVEDLNALFQNPFMEFLTNHPRDDSLVARVKHAIGSDLSDFPQLPEVASKLELHEKKLHRMLKEESITYREIKNELRRDSAIRHLAKRNLSVEEIAMQTGFSEASAFIRAFKQWTGVTPYTYRKDLI